jgi:co-chaperonin GroES (HSP10)
MKILNCEVEPIRDQIIFRFVEPIINGRFKTSTPTGIIIVEGKEKQLDVARWGLVLAIGPETQDVALGDIVLIKNLQWTNVFTITDKPYWITTSDGILAFWDDLNTFPL